MNSNGENPAQKPRDPVFIGADAAMRRAAVRARKLAEKTDAMIAAGKGAASGKIQGTNTGRDPHERGSRKAE